MEGLVSTGPTPPRWFVNVNFLSSIDKKQCLKCLK